MSAADYELTASDMPFCPLGTLGADMGYSHSSFQLRGLLNTRPEDVEVGMAVMIDDEIMQVTAIEYPVITVGTMRGCADTVPAIHRTDAYVWFFNESIGSDWKAYSAGDTIGVKLLPYTPTGNPIPTEAAPPHQIDFNWRQHRPYPPGNVLCQGTPWFDSLKEMPLESNTLTWNWAHRDRLVQADQLVGHTEGNIGPEIGTTYRIEVRDVDENVLRIVEGLTDTTWTYTREMIEDDGFTSQKAYVDLFSVRDGYLSLQKYRTEIFIFGGDGVIVSFGDLGWPGIKTNCGVSGTILDNQGVQTWEGYGDDSWTDLGSETWANTPSTPIVYEHPVVDLGEERLWYVAVSLLAQGPVSAEVALSDDGVTFGDWEFAGFEATTRYIKTRVTVTGSNPNLQIARLSVYPRD